MQYTEEQTGNYEEAKKPEKKKGGGGGGVMKNTVANPTSPDKQTHLFLEGECY